MDIDHARYDQPHPDPQPSTHRKIELQSSLDLTYLQDNLAQVALQKLNFVLPDNPLRSQPATVIPLGGTESVADPSAQDKKGPNEDDDDSADPLKQQVRELIAEFLHKTWTAAQANLTLNGLDASNVPIPHTATLSKSKSSPGSGDSSSVNGATQSTAVPEEKEGVDFTYAPFDPRLQHKLASLHGELEKLTAEVSKLRREAPRQAAAAYQSTLDAQMASDEEHHATASQQSTDIAEGSVRGSQGGALKLDSVRDGWHLDVKQNYEFGVHQLGSLAGLAPSTGSAVDQESLGTGGNGMEEPSLTETMGKAVRARDVLMEME